MERPAPPTAARIDVASRRGWNRLRPGRRCGAAAMAAALACAALRLSPHATLAARVPLSTAVTATDGTLLRLTVAADGQYRLWTPLPAVSPLLVQATTLYEDRHFRWHPGVNPIALARAAFATYLSRGRRIGGSTITMQLARRLWSIPSRTFVGKLAQIARALQLEAQYSKSEILEAYLNIAPYGGNIEGVGAASEIYFRKRASSLTLAEALTLAVIPQSPARRARGSDAATVVGSTSAPGLGPAPRDAREGLLATWKRADAGANAEPPVRAWPRLRGPDDLPFRAPHFVDQILADHRPPHGDTDDLSDDLSIVATTLSLPLQRLVERHLRGYVAREGRRGLTNAAALLVDTRTMAVRALVGSADFFDPAIAGQVNGTLSKRSPGSTLKPFAYALAMDQGNIHPATMLRDVPTAFASYSPENFDGRFAGPLSAKDALIRSRNVPALAVSARLTRPGLYDFLKTAGIDLPLAESHYGLGLVLGTGEVTMQDLARLYAALATGGVLRPLRFTDRTGGAGNDPIAAADDGVRIVSKESAFLILDMLSDNPRPSGRASASSQAAHARVAWKTGTSWGFRDAWAIGVVGSYVLAVWVGNFSGAGNPAFIGAQAAAPLFFEIVDSVVADEPTLVRWAETPPRDLRRIEVCTVSGGLPTAHCPHRRLSWFIPGRSPIDPCHVHRTLSLDARGQRTCALGPPAVRAELFEVWPSDMVKLFAAAGLPRRPLPAAAAGCADVEAPLGAPPRITSPLNGVTYTLRPRHSDAETVALQAVTDGDAAEVFWFADNTFLGRAPRGTTLFWTPAGPGRFSLRAVDDLGRADVRTVAVEVLR